MVRRRQTQCGVQLRGPTRRGRQRRPGGDPVGGRAGRREPQPDLLRPAGRGVQGRQRADRPRCGRRRPGRHLYADGARGHRLDAGVRAAGCHAFRGVRRLLGPGAEGPDRGRAGQAGHHHRRAVPPRQGGVAEGGGRRSGSSGRGRRKKPGPARAGGAPDRHRRPVDRGPRPVVARHRRERLTRAHPRSVRRRAATVFALHLGHHRRAEGHHAHHRWLPHPGVVHPPQHLRRQAGNRCVLVHRRHRLGHRAHLHRLRSAVQRGDPGALRGHTRPRRTSIGISR